MPRPVIAVPVAIALMGGLSGPVQAAAFTFTTIDAPGASSTSLMGINASGQITGNTNAIAFVDNAGVFTPINVPGALTQFASTFATGINNVGQITGRAPGRFGYQSFVDTNGVFTSGSAYSSSDLDSVMPSGINDAGVLVGTTNTALGGPGPPSNTVSFIGAKILTIPDASGSTPFGLRGLDVTAKGINDAGQVVGVYHSSAGGNVGFLDAAGVITMITAPGAIAGTTAPAGINNLGEITGTYQDAGGTHGFVDINNVFSTLDVPGALPGTTVATAVNDLGVVVGSYSTAAGSNGFLAAPAIAMVPEPATLALFGIGLAGIAAARRRTSPQRS